MVVPAAGAAVSRRPGPLTDLFSVQLRLQRLHEAILLEGVL